MGAGEALASGGAHVVDDAEVETPGLCHAETWVTRFDPDHGLLNSSPACTPRAMPNMEIGGTIQHMWQRGDSDTQIGPALKFALRPVDYGIGVGVAFSGLIDARSGDARSAAVLLPVTFDLSKRVRANLNLGYQWADRGDRHAVFTGAQINVKATESVSLMAEAFCRDGGKPAFQAGARWAPLPWVDIDLLGGRRIDGAPTTAITLGLTIRA